jgi:transposase
VQRFRTTAADRVVLRDWLAAHGVTQVAIESTGVYWKPVFYALESDFTCLLVNAMHITRVPRQKTDVQDCVWIAQTAEASALVAREEPTLGFVVAGACRS